MAIDFASSDRMSPTWNKLSIHIKERIQSLRTENDGDHNAEQTAKKRGQIAAFKELLALETYKPPSQD